MWRAGAWEGIYDPNRGVVYTPSAGGIVALNLSVAYKHSIVMPAGNVTIAVVNETANMIFSVRILQDGVGSRTVTWFTTIKWVDGSAPTLTTTADKADQFVFLVTAADQYDGYIVGQNV